MLLSEWNMEEWGEVQKEEGREEGQTMILELMEQGYSAEQIRAKIAAKEALTE